MPTVLVSYLPCAALAANRGRPPADLDAWRPWQLAPHVRERLDFFARG